ncbi:MAG: hypothetical protein M1822_003358 [Bathelium mastoideum]|nr:MAG: hypothetical protein M1822_003358 [Bathelium mastoideum]
MARRKPSSASSPDSSPPDISILGNQVAIHPSGYTESSAPLPDSQAEEQPLLERWARFRTSPFDFLREISVYISGDGWRSYDRVVGQPVFYSGFSENMKAMVLSNPMLRAKLSELAEGRVVVEEREGLFRTELGTINVAGREKRRKEVEKQLGEVAAEMTDSMICKMESKRFIRGAYYLVTQLLTRAYHQGIHVSAEEVLRLRSVAEQAARRKHSIIFLPCHKSHIDYISLQLICYRLGLTLPVVVAGDNLNFPLVGAFLQHAGAMWIRRSFGGDALYTTLVQSYVDTMLREGFNFECFVEGGRSRTGKLLPPKFGILSFLVDSVLSGRVDDAVVCPVSTQYDKVIEVDSYISELLGQPKKKESLQEFLSASSILSLKLGRVDVRFHEPWSLKDFISQQKDRYSRLPQPMSYQDQRIRLLRAMGYKVLSDINAVSVAMPTALIGTVLLTLRGRGVGRSELVRRVDWLSERVKQQGGRVAHFAGLPTDVVVQRGLEVLGPGLVGIVEGLPEDTYHAVDRFQLSFYRNMIIHLFISEALVSAAMYTKVKLGGGPETQRISYDELLEQVLFLSQLFRGEFIFPTEGLAVNLEKTLAGLEADDVIKVIRGDSGVYVELSDSERQHGRENYDFYCFLIWPFIEAAWLGAISLFMLTPPSKAAEGTWLDAKRVQDQAQLLGKTLYHQGDLEYFESVNKETLKNGFERFQEEGIIVVTKSKDARIPATVQLHGHWMPNRDSDTGRLAAEGKVWDFAEAISQSRREGKNRRDGTTVTNRVMSHVDEMGRALFEEAATETTAQTHEIDERTGSAKKGRLRRKERLGARL